MEENEQIIRKKFQQALTLQQQNKIKAALQVYREILVLDDTHHDAIVNLAALLRRSGQTDTALQLLDRAVILYPQSVYVRFNLGNLYYANSHFKSAAQNYRDCTALADRLPGFHARFAETLRQLSEYIESIPHYRKACKSDPDNLTVVNNFADTLIKLDMFDEALPLLERLTKVHPGVMAPIGNLANLHYRCNRVMAAIQYYKEALKLEPNSTELHKGLGVAYQKTLEMDLAEEHFNRAISLGVSNSRVNSNLLYLQAYREDRTSAAVYEMHRSWGESIESRLPENEFPHHDYSPDRPLKIGIISPDLHDHPVVHFMLPFYENISNSRFSVYSYADSHKMDVYSRQVKEFSNQWREVSKLNDRQLAKIVLEDKIDIAIDLAGHSSSNRIECFAARLAPVQMSYLGYVNTTGLSRIDYRICDRMVNPESTQSFYSETLLPIDCFSCYRPLDTLPPVSEGPAMRNGYITFGSVNNASKLSPSCIALWSKILHQVSGSKLLLKAGQFADEWVRDKFRQQFINQKITPDRLIFEGHSTSKEKFLDVFESIDLSLDPFPHNGGTTTHDTLSMGVAAISLTGDVYIKRFGFQIMTLSGNKEFIARSLEDYVEVAVKFAESGGETRATRQSRRDRFLKSALTDSHRFISDMENALLGAWEKKCQQMTGT